jgi:hypothetical protein
LPEDFYSGWLPALLKKTHGLREFETGGQESVYLSRPPQLLARAHNRLA